MDRSHVDPATTRAERPVRRYFYLLLLAPFVGTLWVSTYAHDAPRLFGFPFFYWYSSPGCSPPRGSQPSSTW
jgi:hypothetical protein